MMNLGVDEHDFEAASTVRDVIKSLSNDAEHAARGCIGGIPQNDPDPQHKKLSFNSLLPSCIAKRVGGGASSGSAHPRKRFLPPDQLQSALLKRAAAARNGARPTPAAQAGGVLRAATFAGSFCKAQLLGGGGGGGGKDGQTFISLPAGDTTTSSAGSAAAAAEAVAMPEPASPTCTGAGLRVDTSLDVDPLPVSWDLGPVSPCNSSCSTSGSLSALSSVISTPTEEEDRSVVNAAQAAHIRATQGQPLNASLHKTLSVFSL